MKKENKIKAILALNDKLITADEFKANCIHMVKQPDGSYIRASTGEKYKDLKALMDSISCVKMILPHNDDKYLCFFTFIDMMIAASSKKSENEIG